MAEVFSAGYVDTAMDGVTTLPLNRGLVNFGADWAQVPSSKKGEVLLTNITCPQGFPERFRYSSAKVANVYANSGISSAYHLPSSDGTKVLVQLTEVWNQTDDADASVDKRAPISGYIVLTYPNDKIVTAARMETFIARLLSGFYNSGVVTTERLNAILRGALVPSGL